MTKASQLNPAKSILPTADELLTYDKGTDSYTLNCGKAKYLGQVIRELPTNCMLNKVTTGCGGTTLALESKEPYVICVPFISLIKNKRANYGRIQPVYGRISREELDSYKGNKWMVTYDSLWKVMERIDTGKYNLLIDESHKLIDSGSFRGDAIRRVKSEYDKFKSFTFLTATPVKRKYLPPWLSELKQVNVVWDNLEEVQINKVLIPEGRPIETYVASKVIDILDGNDSINPYIFMNSVTGICKIIEKLKNSGYDCDNFSIICSQQTRNEELIKRVLGDNYGACVNKGLIGQTIEGRVQIVSQSRVTFITSTMFEGCDIHDVDGKTFIIADGAKEHTRYDIGTTIPQIIGRIRNSQYKSSTTLIYKPNRMYTSTTEEAFELVVKEKLAESEKVLETYNMNSTNSTFQKIIENGSRTNPFFTTDTTGSLIIDNEAWYNQMHQWEALHKTYYVNRDWKTGKLKDGSETLTINSINYDYTSIKPDDMINSKISSMKASNRTNFKVLLQEYIKLSEAAESNKKELDAILELEPNIKGIYDKLGVKKIKELRYSKSKINNEMTKQSGKNDVDKIFLELVGSKYKYKYRVGSFRTLAEIKVDLQAIRTDLGICGNAKASDLEQYFQTKLRKLKLAGVEERSKGYQLIACIYRVV